MRKIVFSCLTIFLALVSVMILSIPQPVMEAVKTESTATVGGNYLLLGLDEAAGNTDAILLVHYDNKNGLVCMQLPRDTYLSSGRKNAKINGIFASCLSRGETEAEALRATATEISEALGVHFAGAAALHFSAVETIVDALDGVPLTVPFAMQYDDAAQGLHIRLEPGETVLSGKEAVQFLRYRTGYTEGDLGRTDMQKVFLAALFTRAAEKMTPLSLISLTTRMAGHMQISVDMHALFRVLTSMYENRDRLDTRFLTAPGAAILENGESGISYYVLNRAAMQSALVSCAFADESHFFDAQARFCKDNLHFRDVYYAGGYVARIYTMEQLKNMMIKKE